MKKTINLKMLLFVAVMAFAGAQQVQAQAFDADYDFKIFAGYLNKGGKSGVLLGAEYGRSRFFSFGCFAQALFNVKNDDGEKMEFISCTELNFRCNFHWTDVFHLPSNFDIYTGINTGLRAVGLQGGIRYNFSERFGLYGEVQQPLMRTFVSDDKDFYNKLFSKKFGFSVGFTINL